MLGRAAPELLMGEDNLGDILYERQAKRRRSMFRRALRKLTSLTFNLP